MRFASFLSRGFTIVAVMNPSENKLEKHTSVHWGAGDVYLLAYYNSYRTRQYNPLLITNCLWILTIHKAKRHST